MLFICGLIAVLLIAWRIVRKVRKAEQTMATPFNVKKLIFSLITLLCVVIAVLYRFLRPLASSCKQTFYRRPQLNRRRISSTSLRMLEPNP